MAVIINTASMGVLLPMLARRYTPLPKRRHNFTRSLGYLAGIQYPRERHLPSFPDPPLVRRSGDERVEEWADGRGILMPEDIAAGVVELIEDDSRFGSVMRVTVRGGRDFTREVRAF